MTVDANAVKLFYQEESVYGTVPTSASTSIRYTGESIKPSQATTRSEEIDSLRSTTTIHRVDVGAAGAINTELILEEHDVLLQYALQAAAVPSAGTATTNATGSTANVINDSQFTAANGVNEGVWVFISNVDGTNQVQTGYAKITAFVEATSITVEGITIVNTGTMDVTILGNMVNGSTFKSFTLGKEFTSAAFYGQYPGSAVAGVTIAGERGGIITANFDIIGQKATSPNPTALWGTIAAVGSNPPMNSVDHLENAIEGLNYANRINIISFSLNIQNALRAQTVMGTLGATGLGNGSMTVEGSFTKYFESQTQLDSFLAFTTSSFSVGLQDELGNLMNISCPAIKYTDAQRVAGGKDTDIIAELSFEAFRNPNGGSGDDDEDIMVMISTFDI